MYGFGVDTFTINGKDYPIKDTTARETADEANTNATNAINGLPHKKNIASYIAPSCLYIDVSNKYGNDPNGADNQTKKFINGVTASLPDGAQLGIIDTFYFDSNNIAVRLLDIRTKKVYFGYWWGYSEGWQLWTEG